jgi:Domain of unknown function (DUF2828)
MDAFTNAMFSNDSLTNNGAVTHSTAGMHCLDLFFIAGASRFMSEEDILKAFIRAYREDKNTALKILFWARDARGGAGEKRFFQVIMKQLSVSEPEVYEQVAIYIPTFGYWKDIFVIEKPTEDTLNWLSIQLKENENANLLAKWFPRKGEWFVAMHKYLKVSAGAFRRRLTSMSNTVEQKMCANEWETIQYSTVPSVAGKRYAQAFQVHDGIRYASYISDVMEGKVKINASVLFPSDLVHEVTVGSRSNTEAYDAMWNALPNYMEGCTERILPVCDVSGSMMGQPMDVSIGLGLYISERNEGPFKDLVLTFSESPEFHKIEGNSLSEKVFNLGRANWGMNTNLNKTFSVLLDRAIAGKVAQEDMPTKLLIISDMEFDQACGNRTNFESIKNMYEQWGYQMPSIVFWNVNGRLGNVPVKANTPNTALVSGYSPSILTSILGGKDLNPYSVMMETIGKPRYACIKVD